MNHYWNGNLGEDFAPELFEFQFGGRNFSMYSSGGVFSSFQADEGSLILLSCLLDRMNMYLSGWSSEELELFRVLDLGCGNGLLSLLCAFFLEQYRGEMTDISPRALVLSEMNIKKFQMEDRLKAYESDKYRKVEGLFDIIFTNPPIRTGKSNVHEILEGARLHLKEGGEFYAVIRKNHGAPSALKKLKEVYGNAEIIKKSKGFYVLYAKNLALQDYEYSSL